MVAAVAQAALEAPEAAVLEALAAAAQEVQVALEAPVVADQAVLAAMAQEVPEDQAALEVPAAGAQAVLEAQVVGAPAVVAQEVQAALEAPVVAAQVVLVAPEAQEDQVAVAQEVADLEVLAVQEDLEAVEEPIVLVQQKSASIKTLRVLATISTLVHYLMAKSGFSTSTRKNVRKLKRRISVTLIPVLVEVVLNASV